jgi:hypothetical protein
LELELFNHNSGNNRTRYGYLIPTDGGKMGMKKLEVEISDTPHDRLYKVVPDPAFLWRNKGETAYRAVERAVETALNLNILV